MARSANSVESEVNVARIA
jgi:hypothetical protein